MSAVKRHFYANRDMRAFDARLSQLEDTVQQILDHITQEIEGPVTMIHQNGGMYRVFQGNRVIYPLEGVAKKEACQSYIDEYLASLGNSSLEGGDIAEALVTEPGPVLEREYMAPKGNLTPQKLGSRETDDGIQRYLEFTDKTEMILTEEQFEKAREGGLEAIMEIVNG